MKLAINYSPQARRLADQQRIELDLFKCPPASDPVVKAYAPALLQDALASRPVYVHFPLHAGDGSIGASRFLLVNTPPAPRGRRQHCRGKLG